MSARSEFGTRELESWFETFESGRLNPPLRLADADIKTPPIAAPATKYVAPRTAVEESLVAIWQTVLGLPRVGNPPTS